MGDQRGRRDDGRELEEFTVRGHRPRRRPLGPIADNFEHAVQLYRDDLWMGDDPPRDVIDAIAEIRDPSAWEPDSDGETPWRFHESFEDGSLSVYRVAD